MLANRIDDDDDDGHQRQISCCSWRTRQDNTSRGQHRQTDTHKHKAQQAATNGAPRAIGAKLLLLVCAFVWSVCAQNPTASPMAADGPPGTYTRPLGAVQTGHDKAFVWVVSRQPTPTTHAGVMKMTKTGKRGSMLAVGASELRADPGRSTTCRLSQFSGNHSAHRAQVAML